MNTIFTRRHETALLPTETHAIPVSPGVTLFIKRRYNNAVKRQRDKALELELDGKYKQAAALYLDEGKAEKAAFLYQKAGMVEEAIDILTQERLWVRAADMCYRLERYREAGEFYERVPNLTKAVDAYMRAREFPAAASVLKKQNQPLKAAKMYIKAGDYLKAGAIFEEMGDGNNAVKAYRKYLVEQTNDTEKLAVEDARRIGKIFEKAGEPGRAAELMIRARNYEQAFHLALVSGNETLAEEIMTRHLPGQGYHLLSVVQDSGDVLVQYGDFFMRHNDPDIASMAFERVEDWDRAAEAYEKAGNIERSAELYFKMGRYEKAAPLFENAGQYGTAADTYYKLKNMAKAAENYEKDGDYYKAGRLYQFLGDHEKAVSDLQKISTDAPEYLKATGIISQAFIKIGLYDLAKKRIDEVLNAYQLSHDNLDVFTEIAAALMEIGALERAKKMLENIISIDFSREEAKKLLVQLQKKEAVSPPPAPPRPSPQTPLSEPAAEPSPSQDSSPRMTRGMQVLKKFAFFRFLRDDDIAAIWPAIERYQAKAGEAFITSGKPARNFYLLAKGNVKISSAMGVELGIINVKDTVFGLVACLSGEEAAVTMSAGDGCAVLKIERDRFFSYLKQIPREKGETIPDHIVQTMMKELSYLEKASVYHQQFDLAKQKLKTFFK